MQALQRKLQQDKLGAITYASFIETALYDWDEGYYMSDNPKIGKRGDFITTSSVSSVYGKVMAQYFLRKSIEEKLSLNIYEIGGGEGQFAQSVIEQLLIEGITEFTYTIVEVSPFHRKCQNLLLNQYEQIKIVETLSEIDGDIEGFVFSNELFDALPVHVIEKFQNELYEIYVTWDEEQYSELYFPLENELIKEYLSRHQIQLQNHQRFEVALEMENIMEDLFNKLKKGFLITVDYGVTKEQLAHKSRHNGTLRGYYQHQLLENVLAYPGIMDITYHVHWDEYLRISEELGFVTHKHVTQKEFFLEENIFSYLIQHASTDPFSKEARWNRGIHSLVVDGGMSDSFTIIVQKKQ